MKKLMFVAMILLAADAALAQAPEPSRRSGAVQYTSIGPVLGFGGNWVTNMGGRSVFMPSGNIGIGLIYARKEHWGWGGQLLVSTEGYNKDYNGRAASGTPVYLRLPVRAYYFFNSFTDKVRPKLFFGPALGIKLGEQDYRDYANGDVEITRNTGPFRTFDFGLNAGGGVNIRLQKSIWLNLDLGYYQGLTDAVNDHANNYNTNQNLGIGAGVLFGIR